MSPHTPDTTPAALIARAKAEMAVGGYEAATTCALVAIAEALVAQMPAEGFVWPPESNRVDQITGA